MTNFTVHMLVDADGLPAGFFPSDLYLSPPEGSFEVTFDQWMEFLNNQGSRRWNGQQVVEYTPPPVGRLTPTLTRRQLRLGLLANGITTAQVEGVIAAIPDPVDREVAQIEWADATSYERSHPLVDQIGVALGLSPEQIDAMWLAAASL